MADKDGVVLFRTEYASDAELAAACQAAVRGELVTRTVDTTCGQVRQVFEVTCGRQWLAESLDVKSDATLEIMINHVLAGSGVQGLRAMGFKVRRLRYESPHPGGYVGPERIVLMNEDAARDEATSRWGKQAIIRDRGTDHNALVGRFMVGIQHANGNVFVCGEGPTWDGAFLDADDRADLIREYVGT